MKLRDLINELVIIEMGLKDKGENTKDIDVMIASDEEGNNFGSLNENSVNLEKWSGKLKIVLFPSDSINYDDIDMDEE